jgi:tetratricopeptide (TPR) repeat protein
VIKKYIAGFYRLGSLITLCCIVLSGCAFNRFPLVRPAGDYIKKNEALKKAENQFLMGLEYEMRGMEKNALLCFEESYKIDPTSTTLRNILIEKYFSERRFIDAVLLIKNRRKETELPDADKKTLTGIYIRMGQGNHAAELLESVSAKKKEDWFMLGLMYETLGNLPKSLHAYESYLKSNPSDVEMALKIGAMYVYQKRCVSAESLYVATANSVGKNAKLLNAIGECRVVCGDTTGAISFFTMAMVEDSLNKDALVNIAQLHVLKKDYDQAVPLYEKLYGLDSLSPSHVKTLALMYLYAKNYNKAKDLLLKQLSVDKDNSDLRYYLGMVNVAQDSINSARDAFEKALIVNPDLVDAWVQLCYLEIHDSDNDAALFAAVRFKNALPQEPVAWRTEGYIYNVRKEYDKAVVSLSRAVDLDSSDTFTWFELGSACERAKKYKNAELAFKKVLLLNPHDASAANYLGYMWVDKGEKLDSAQKLLRMALNQDSLNGAYLDSYAWLMYKKGNIDSAYTVIKKAMDTISDDPTVFAHYGYIMLLKKDTTAAFAAFKKSLAIDPKSDDANAIEDLLKKNGVELPPIPDKAVFPKP